MSETNTEPEVPEQTTLKRGRTANKPAEKKSSKPHYARELLDMRNRVLTALDLLDESLKEDVDGHTAAALVRVAAKRLRGES